MNEDRSLRALLIRTLSMKLLHQLRISAVAAAFSSLTLSSNAAILSTNGSRDDVQAKINSAVDGDTVELPAGRFIWASGVSVAGKGIQLKGKGAGRVVARSASSVTVGIGTKVFTLLPEAVPSIANLRTTIKQGDILKIYRTGGEQNGTFMGTGQVPWMRGMVGDLNGTTLTMNITSTNRNGNHPLWIITTEAETTIVHDGPSNTNMLTVVEDASHNSEISSIRFEHSAREGRDVINQLYLSPATAGKPILVHDCYFERTNAGDNIRAAVHRGVIWNCSFVSLPMSFNYLAIHNVADGYLDSWTTPGTMGTADSNGTSNLYIEDSDIHAYISGTDFDANSRAVVRRTLVNHASLASHGADTGPYGVRHVEIYECEFAFNPFATGQTLPLDRQINMRGGTWVITENTIPRLSSQDYGNKTDITMECQNIQRAGGPNPGWGFDIPGVQYPCPRQVGMGRVTGNGRDGKGQTMDSITYVGDPEPSYVWDNAGGPTIGVREWGWVAGLSIGASESDFLAKTDQVADYIKINRDYFVGIRKPSWTKPTGTHLAAHPHSLRGAPRFVQITVVQQ